MDNLQERMIKERLGALADILGQIGHEFKLSWSDSEGNIWAFNIKKEQTDDR